MSCAYSVFLLYIGLMFAAAASLVVRLVRSDGEERQQIKWFIFAAAFVPVWFVLNTPVEQASPVLFSVLDALVVSGVPVAAGIAILRHRLYDIDRIINRTIVYAPLTAALLALYFVAIVVSQQVLVLLIGQQFTLAVVASTLVIAALFNPLRRRTQSFVDRHFYRRKDDARNSLESFSTTLRDETDLVALNDELLWVVRETVQPAHVPVVAPRCEPARRLIPNPHERNRFLAAGARQILLIGHSRESGNLRVAQGVGLRGGGPAVALPFNRTRYEAFTKAYPPACCASGGGSSTSPGGSRALLNGTR